MKKLLDVDGSVKSLKKSPLVIASEAKQSHNRMDLKENATALRASQ
jgi:hypothetical protein